VLSFPLATQAGNNARTTQPGARITHGCVASGFADYEYDDAEECMKFVHAKARAVAPLLLLAPVLNYPIDATAAKNGTARGDSRKPSVSITSPADGAMYASDQTVSVTAKATDNVGVSRVEFYRNGVLQSTDTAAPYAHSWSITRTANGSHSWTAKAYDAAGNTATSAAVSVTVNIGDADTAAPATSIMNPTAGTVYTTAQNVTVNASATDNVGVSRVEFYRNGALQGTDVTSPYTYSWSVNSAVNGSHSWTSKAFDAAGNAATSSPVSVSVDIPPPDTTAPSVTIQNPLSGTTYTTAQTVTVDASASDNVGVSRVEFYKGGVLQSTDTTSPYSHAWSITSASNGSHSWTARAFDAAGNNTTSSAVSVTVNIPAPDTTSPTVAITAPASGTTYTSAQTVSVNANASDNVGVARVEFYKDGVLQSTDTTLPYSHAWSITSADNGTHNWAAKAFDAAGNNATSVAVSTTVNIASLAGVHQWSLQFGGATTADTAAGRLTAIDPNGEVIVVASVSGAVTFGEASHVSSGGIVLAKYSADGQALRWSRLWTREVSAEFMPTGLAVNADGSAIVTGYFYGTVTFAGGNSLTGAGGYDLFMVKYASDGALLWSRRFGGTGSETATALATDGMGNLFVTGWIQGSASLGGTAHSSNSGSRDVFVAKYSSNGAFLWSRAFGGNTTDQSLAVAVDAGGNPTISGFFQGSVNFGDGTLTSAGLDDVFVANFTADGTLLRSWREGGTGRDQGRALGVDGLGNLMLAASFEGTASMGGQSLTSAGATDIALVKYDSSGPALWVRRFGGSNTDMVNGMAGNAAGEIAITGTFLRWISLGGADHYGDGSTDVFIAKYDASGNRRWSRGAGVAWDDYGNGIALDDDGGVVATGQFYSGIDLGGGLLSTATGSTDGYLVRYGP
jgi:hypothetical protein